ncbi:MAG TPA: response regulator transcription factor [Acidobacteriota bacterium]
MGKIRILIVDDHTLFRSGLRLLIGERSDMEVVGEASDGDEALIMTKTCSPDVVLMDISMPGTGGIQATEKIRENFQNTKVVILTMHEDPVYVRSALAAGATGYIVKKAADSELISAIRAVYRGRTFIDSSQAEETIFPANAKRKHAHGQLSEREYQVLKLLARGYTHQQIAEEIVISIKSVETYRSRLTRKLELHTRADLIRYALEMGLLS